MSRHTSLLQRLRPLVTRIADEVRREFGERPSSSTAPAGTPIAPAHAPTAGQRALGLATRLWNGRTRR